jgi:hypothetical protein
MHRRLGQQEIPCYCINSWSSIHVGEPYVGDGCQQNGSCSEEHIHADVGQQDLVDASAHLENVKDCREGATLLSSGLCPAEDDLALNAEMTGNRAEREHYQTAGELGLHADADEACWSRAR